MEYLRYIYSKSNIIHIYNIVEDTIQYVDCDSMDNEYEYMFIIFEGDELCTLKFINQENAGYIKKVFFASIDYIDEFDDIPLMYDYKRINEALTCK